MTERAAWSFVSGQAGALRGRLLDRRAILAVRQASTAEERRARLRASVLFADAPPAERPFDEVEERFVQSVQSLGALSPDARVARLLLDGRDWAELREAARAAAAGTTRAGVRADGDRWAAVLRGDAQEPGTEAFAAGARRAVAERPREADPGTWVDRVLDAHEAAALIRTAREAGGETLAGWIETWVRLRGALAFARARALGWDTAAMWTEWRLAGLDSPELADVALGDDALRGAALRALGLPVPDKDTGPVAMERAVDERMSHVVSGASGEPFGPEVLFAFLWALRIEALNLRIVLAAADSGMSDQRIAAELRTEAA